MTTGPDTHVLLAARATVNLPWVRVGESILVDPDLGHVAACLEAQYLVPLPADQQPDAHKPPHEHETIAPTSEEER